MSFKLTNNEICNFTKDLVSKLNDIVFNNINKHLKEHPEDRKFINPAFPYPKNIRIGILENFLVIEYIGPEEENKDTFNITVIYQPDSDIFKFLELDIPNDNTPTLNQNESIENLNFFLGNSIDYLCDYFYDFVQIREDFMLNGYIDLNQTTNPIVVNNCTFFYTDCNDGLKIRHIDLLEIFPFQDNGIAYHTDYSLLYFSNYIISNKIPQYDIKLHNILNKFIELINLRASCKNKFFK